MRTEQLHRDAALVSLASRHPGMPRGAKLAATLSSRYIFGPVDILPDFVPGLGFIDEALVIPFLVKISLHLTPEDVKRACLPDVDKWLASYSGRPTSKTATLMFHLIWLLLAWVAWKWWRILS